MRGDGPARDPECSRGLVLGKANQIPRGQDLPLAQGQSSHLAQELRAFPVHLGRVLKD